MKVGLITYHSAYNFGSVLQAYATQKSIQDLGHDCNVINYRMPSQKNFYSIFPLHVGKRAFINHVLALTTIRERLKRQRKYEQAINSIFNLTKELNYPEQFESISEKYDVYVSGSDQIWSARSCELAFCDNWQRYIQPYLLSFTNKKKISYASSPNFMSDDELSQIKDEILKFNQISCREQESSEQLFKILDRKIETVLDPTLLLAKEEWNEFLGQWENKYTNGKYIFYYVLKGTRSLNKDLKELNSIASKMGYKIVTSSPLSIVFPNSNIINAIDACIYDFLGLIRNAEYIVTDSYHGTLFSVNFNKNFYSLQKASGVNKRVEQMAEKLGFYDRIIYSLNDINLDTHVDYRNINMNREKYRKQSIDYLKNAIEN